MIAPKFENESIWEYYNRPDPIHLVYSLTFDFVFIFTGVYHLLEFWPPALASVQRSALDIIFILIGIYHFIHKTINFHFAQTVKYILTENEVMFEYGLFKKRIEVIPFTEIIDVRIEEDEKTNLSSIIIYTPKKIKYRGYNNHEGDLRAHPSFDFVSDPNIPYEILKEGIKGNNVSALKKQLSDQLQGKDVSESRLAKRKEWNTVLAHTYLVTAFLILLSFLDVHILKPNKVNDVFTGYYPVLNYEGTQAFVTCYTKEGNHFRVFYLQGSPGHKLYISKSKIFGIIHHVDTDSGIRVTSNSTMIYGFMNAFFPFLAIYLCYAGATILKNGSIINSDDREFLYIGPIMMLLLIRFIILMGTA